MFCISDTAAYNCAGFWSLLHTTDYTKFTICLYIFLKMWAIDRLSPPCCYIFFLFNRSYILPLLWLSMTWLGLVYLLEHWDLLNLASSSWLHIIWKLDAVALRVLSWCRLEWAKGRLLESSIEILSWLNPLIYPTPATRDRKGHEPDHNRMLTFLNANTTFLQTPGDFQLSLSVS